MGLTFKQYKFIRLYLDNGRNGTKAALAVYGTKDSHTAHQIAYENLRKPEICEYMNLKMAVFI